VSDDPRDALLAVAREIIAKRGYVGLSMRTASAAAGVTEDVALRYYRNRESLFAAAMRLPVDPVSAIPALMAPGIEGMGERLVRFTLDTLRDPAARDDLISLARTGVSAGHAVTGLQEFIEIGVVDRVAGMIGVPDARMRSALITSYLLGVATMRYGVRLEPLASASDEEVIRMVAPVIQDLLDPRRPIPGSARARARSAAPATSSGQSPYSGQPARKFDPDPAATRAAEAARLAAEAARFAPPKPAGAPVPPARPRSSARPAPSRPATRTTTASPPPEVVEKAPAKKAPGRKAPAKKAPARKAPAKKAPAKKAPAKKAPAKKAPAKKAPAKKAPATQAAPAPGPKHAQATPEQEAAVDSSSPQPSSPDPTA
jgi:AcrR family transcriptional regulator